MVSDSSAQESPSAASPGKGRDPHGEAVIQVSHLSKTFLTGFAPYKWPYRLVEKISPAAALVLARKVRAVRDLSFEVHPGEVFGLLGPNGAGKTTTLKVMMGLLFADRGVVRLFGRPAGDLWAKQKTGFLPENPYFYDYLKPQEFLDLVARLTDVEAAKRKRRVDEMLELAGLSQAVDRPLRKFSKGMLQRVGVAQALIHDPDLVVLDEPLSGLDPVGRKEIRDLIKQLGAEGKTVLFSSHILSDVELLCDRVAIMVAGELRKIGPLDELLTSPTEETEVVLSQVDVSLQAFLEQGKNWAVNVRGQKVQVILPGAEPIEPWLSKVMEKGARIVSVMGRRRSLEDLFVDQTRAAGQSKASTGPQTRGHGD